VGAKFSVSLEKATKGEHKKTPKRKKQKGFKYGTTLKGGSFNIWGLDYYCKYNEKLPQIVFKKNTVKKTGGFLGGFSSNYRY
jgi:hypothetical protein